MPAVSGYYGLQARQAMTEASTPMTLILNLSPELERQLQGMAATAGQSLEAYVQELIEKQVRGLNGESSTKTWQEICAPIAEAFAESGLTDEELKDFLTEVRDEVRADKRSKREPGSTSG
jgi:hypothetical protein